MISVRKQCQNINTVNNKLWKTKKINTMSIFGYDLQFSKFALQEDNFIPVSHSTKALNQLLNDSELNLTSLIVTSLVFLLFR